MRKAKVTYIAPDGDNPVVEMGGQRFFDGQAVDLNTDDHGSLLDRLGGNPWFDVVYGEEEKSEPKRPGRPKKKVDVDKAQKEYADQENADKTGVDRPNSSYQGGPLPGGKTVGVPNTGPDPVPIPGPKPGE